MWEWATKAWDAVSEFAGDATDWFGKNPEAAVFLGTAAAGAIQGYMTNEQMKQQQKQWQDEQRMKERRPSSGGDNYASHLAQLSGGTGLLANAKYLQ